MSRQQIASHYKRLAAKWPQDVLRPEHQFQAVFQKRIENPPVPYRPEEREANAAYLLLDNAIRKQFPLPDNLLRPASNPDHYENLKKELDALPSRTWLSGFMKRIQNMVRFK